MRVRKQVVHCTMCSEQSGRFPNPDGALLKAEWKNQYCKLQSPSMQWSVNDFVLSRKSQCPVRNKNTFFCKIALTVTLPFALRVVPIHFCCSHNAFDFVFFVEASWSDPWLSIRDCSPMNWELFAGHQNNHYDGHLVVITSNLNLTSWVAIWQSFLRLQGTWLQKQ